MSVFLLLSAFGSLWYGESARCARRGESAPIRLGLLTVSLLLTAVVAGLTEVLSYASRLNGTHLFWAWLVMAGGGLVWAVGQRVPMAFLPILRWSVLSRMERYWLATTAVLFALTLLTALLYPPNNNDSLTYHMGRIGHWMQQQSIRPFATHIERQLYQPPLSEWIILHTMGLAGSDLFANAVQWVAGGGCCVALSLLTRMFGGNRTGQVATVFAAATVPMVILQMSSTQNDVVVSYYLIVLAVYLLRYYRTKRASALVWAGLSLGFACLTKGTAYLLAAPLVTLWGVAELLRLPRRGWLKSALPLAGVGLLIVGLALAINAGHYARNLSVYGHPLTDAEEQSHYTNEVHTVGMMVSNVSRNLALHFGFPGFHWVAQHGVERLHDWLGMPITDARTTYAGAKFDLPRLSNNEDSASNLVHLLWFGAAVGWLFRTRKQPEQRPYLFLALVVIGLFGLFCAYLKWQPWHSRLHSPLFLLACPVMAYGLVNTNQRLIGWLSGLVAASALCFALTNPFRPLITVPPLTQPVSFLNGRGVNYYVNERTLLPFHRTIVAFINGQPRDSLRVGLIIGENNWDYLWFREIRSSVRLHHVRVQTPSRVVDSSPPVDYVISTRTWSDTLIYSGLVYQRVFLKPDRISFLMPSLFEPIKPK